MSITLTLLLCGLATTTGFLRGKQAGTIESLDLNKALSDMQPEVVAKLLAQVEMRWKESRVASLRNQTDESSAVAEMTKSCAKVARAVIDGSEGDKDRVVEYMADVCSRGENKIGCNSFAAGIEGVMTNDVEVNRDNLDLKKFCVAYWESSVSTEAKKEAQKLNEEEAARAKEAAERAETERKAQEEADATRKATDAQTEEAKAVEESSKLQEVASHDEEQASNDTKSVDDRIAAAESSASGLVDEARQALQLAAEKEAKALEPKAAEPQVNATEAEVASAPVDDEKAAEAAGDAIAEKIADKALAKDANKTAMLAVVKNVTKKKCAPRLNKTSMLQRSALARSLAVAKRPDPTCATGVVSLAGAVADRPQACCPAYCGECSDYPQCDKVRGQDSANACCLSKVLDLECGGPAKPAANVCLKQCADTVPPCIMAAGEKFEMPDVTSAAEDCNEAVGEWMDKAEAGVKAGKGGAASWDNLEAAGKIYNLAQNGTKKATVQKK